MTETISYVDSKFAYPTSLSYTWDRIHDPFKYRHFHDEDELLNLLKRYIFVNRKIESKWITIIESYSYLDKYEDSMNFCKKRITDLRFLIEIIGLNMTRYFEADDIGEDGLISRKMSTLHSSNTEETGTNCSSDEEHFDINTFYETWTGELKGELLTSDEKLNLIKTDFYHSWLN